MFDKKLVVFSGIQPSGNITLGNYLGVVKNITNIQNKYLCFLCIADLHAFTKDKNMNKIKKNIISNVAFYIAAGLNHKKVIIFKQSEIKEHLELNWLLSCCTNLSFLNKMTQYKNNEKLYCNLGLYSYPILMSSDIMLYNTNLVPVGEDQKQHIELAINLSKNVNTLYRKKIFKIQIPFVRDKMQKIMSLNNGKKKMSKSDDSDLSRINMLDTPNIIKKKIMKAKTDSHHGITYDPNKRPEISNLLRIYSGITNISLNKLQDKFECFSHNDFKKYLIDVLINKNSKIRKKSLFLIKNNFFLKKILTNGMLRASHIAKKNINKIRKKITFI